MKNKILTVSIAAYNVEQYLQQTLDSLIVDEIMDELEVLIINDGSKDQTAKVASVYTEKYPDTFKLVNKENGGYGSTINTGVEKATGKYFKQLDGDDWFDSKELPAYMKTLRESKADLVLSNYTENYEGTDRIDTKICCELPVGKTYKLDEVINQTNIQMYCIAYKTELLKKHKLKIEEHCFYTDLPYVLKPLMYMKTCENSGKSIYCYRLGRAGQSVELKSKIRRIGEHERVTRNLIKFYSSNKQKMSKNLKMYYDNALKGLIEVHYYIYLHTKATKENKQKLKSFHSVVTETFPEMDKSLNGITLKVTVNSKFTMFYLVSMYNNMKHRKELKA